MPPADNTPDFDKMSPEEIMAWMESIAKRQGATEGFTTAADMDVPEVDPNTAVIDEPGYVPSEGKMRGQRIGPGVPIPKPAAAVPPPTPTPVVPKSVDVPPPAPARQTQIPLEPAPIIERPAARMPEPPRTAPPPPVPAPAAQGTLSWLESLAADQGPSLDFSLDAFTSPAAPAKGEESPVATTDWLADLARVSDLTESAEPEPIPAASVSADTVSWLETLASQQGAAAEELVAPAEIDIPSMADIVDDGPGYTDYAFDTPAFSTRTEPIPAQILPEPFLSEEPPPQDAAAWLDQLASAQKQSAAAPPIPAAPMSDIEIQAALARGENIPHDVMEAWMQRQLQIGAKRPDPDVGDTDAEAPAVPAALPDWLLDQVGPPPPLDEVPPPAQAQPALIEAIFEPPAIQQSDLPDWLREDSDSISSFDDIFATNEQVQVEVPSTIISAPAAGLSAVDMNDPWVEALEMEYQAAHGGVMPTPVAAIPIPDVSPPVTLAAAEFPPEADLTPGELEPAPDWLTGLMPEITAVPADMDAERTAVIEVDPVAIRAEALEEMPDWLQDNMPAASAETQLPADVSASIDEISSWLETIELEPAEIPTWLTETINPPPAPAPVPVAPTPVAEPAPIFAPAAAAVAPVVSRIASAVVDAVTALTSARQRFQENDLDGSLNDYDSLVRSNQSLDEVVTDLTKAVEKHKGNPAVYRVLGDGLMRQGKLQAALDTYRKALNQL